MAEKIYGLTETDLRVLKEMVADWRHRRGNPSGRPRTDLDDGGPAPEVYVARVPSGGIPGLLESPAEPGSALCDVYRLVVTSTVGTALGTGTDSPYDSVLRSVVGYRKRVYNLAENPVLGNQYVPVVRDKYGFWLATPGVQLLIGKLDGALSFGGSAAMSVWQYNGSADVDTGENVTVYDWLLSSGQSVASGKKVVAAVAGGRLRAFGAECP